jgi:prevent-host-death family protein
VPFGASGSQAAIREEFRRSPGWSDNLISVKDVSATDAARSFSAMLDAVEHDRESFRITRAGRPVARVVPAEQAAGRSVKALLRRHQVDGEWEHELARLRELLAREERDWTG